MKLPQKTHERKLLRSGHGVVVGVDEVGMGALAGPVVVCAAAIGPEFYRTPQAALSGVRDSKLLSAKQREALAAVLKKNPLIRHAIVAVSAKEVDRLNIYQAARLGMRKAITKLGLAKTDTPMVLVDGPHPVAGLAWPQEAIVKGDQKIFAIAAASILAKVHRDGVMTRAAKKHPGYGLEVHKGYGTALHRRQIGALGPSAIHRKSFRLTDE